jgi:hypothetical protein
LGAISPAELFGISRTAFLPPTLKF